MLIGITASSSILGFLVALLLFNASVSEGNPLTLNINEINTTVDNRVSSTELDDKLNISGLPFAGHLANPCSVAPRRRGGGNRIMEAQRTRYAAEFYKYLTTYASWYKRDAQNVLDGYALSDCESLGLELLPDTPNLEQLLEMDAETAMNQIYYSLLVHSAYVYFIHHQYSTEIPRCPDVISDEKRLAAQSLILANKQKSLVCTIDTSMSVLGYSQNATDSILEHQLTNLSLCSRMALRDCQVLRSIIHLLGVMEQYARSQT